MRDDLILHSPAHHWPLIITLLNQIWISLAIGLTQSSETMEAWEELGGNDIWSIFIGLFDFISDSMEKAWLSLPFFGTSGPVVFICTSSLFQPVHLVGFGQCILKPFWSDVAERLSSVTVHQWQRNGSEGIDFYYNWHKNAQRYERKVCEAEEPVVSWKTTELKWATKHHRGTLLDQTIHLV